MHLERPTLLGTEEGQRLVERCKECRGHVLRAGDEFVCTSCGVVVRKVEEEEKFHLEVHIQAPSQITRLGSYVGDRSYKDSKEDFNGVSTIGFAKLLSDNMGVDTTERNCSAMIRRVADRLAIPPFVRENALALSKKVQEGSLQNGESERRRRKKVAASCVYALIAACREAGLAHIDSKTILQAFSDIGHTVSRSNLFQLGLESPVSLKPADPAALLRTVLSGLESNEAVLKRLERRGAEPGPYFRRLAQASQTVLSAMDGIKEGRNPRTVAAVSVYHASLTMAPRAVMQREVAVIAGIAEYTVRDYCATAEKELGPLNAGPS